MYHHRDGGSIAISFKFISFKLFPSRSDVSGALLCRALLFVCSRALLGVYRALRLGHRTFVFVRDLCVCEYLELSWVYIGLFCVGLF